MLESASPSAEHHPARIEPVERLVVLARTIHAQGSESETTWKDAAAADQGRLGETCLGRALYRHRSVFQGSSDAPVWSYLELSYFRGIVPVGAIQELVFSHSADAHLLRAEILLTTPSSFVMPRDWQGSTDRPGRQASLEYIDVRPAYLCEYRNIMREYIGPAAAKLVGADRIGTFRAMETAVVLYHDPSLNTDWNQIHLCEVDAGSFKGFGQEFDAALREISPDGGFAGVFAGLDRMRTIPRWTFSEPVVEADTALGQLGSMRPIP